MAIIFDLETDGLENYTKIHTISTFNTDTGTFTRYDRERVREGIIELSKAGLIIGHNIIFFDLPCIKKLYPEFTHQRVLDTLVWARLVYSDIKDIDLLNFRKWDMPTKFIGRHSLRAWGYRLGEYKGDFAESTDWASWSQEMSDYCEQDVRVTLKLYQRLLSKGVSEEALQLEHDVAFIIQRQIAHGFLFDQKKAEKLYITLLQRKQELTKQLQEVFKPWRVKDREFIPKRDNKTLGYVKGVKVVKYKMVEFNPSSRQHIAFQLKQRYGWKPVEFTPSGEAKIDEDVLKQLTYPEAQLLTEYLMIDKRLGMLGEGDKAWMRLVKADGRIHGDVITNGAVTGRMTHNNPNVAQTPAVGVPYGEECRELFCVPEGYKLVGCDAASLELRCLSHYMTKWDGGAYAKIVVEGKKEDGTDIHTQNQLAARLKTRDQAKTFIYAFLYGAGDFKIGTIIGKKAAAGKALKERFFEKIPAMKNLKDAVEKTAEERGYLIGLDGRLLKVRSLHAALNTLLQSAGALIMKKALVVLDRDLQDNGLKPGVDYEFAANIHDEYQIEVKESYAEFVGLRATLAIQLAGNYFNFRCPLDGEFKVGSNWAETH